MNKRYILNADDVEIKVEVDASILTPELATEINEFYSDYDSRLARSDNDPVKAVLLFAFPMLFNALCNGWNEVGAAKRFAEIEGVPEEHGITIVEYIIPEFDYATVRDDS